MGIFNRLKRAYTLAEVIIVLVVISVVVSVTLRVAKMRLDNITTYTYYSAYDLLSDVTGKMLTEYDSQQDRYMEVANASLNILDSFQSSYKRLFNISSKISALNGFKQVQNVSLLKANARELTPFHYHYSRSWLFIVGDLGAKYCLNEGTPFERGCIKVNDRNTDNIASVCNNKKYGGSSLNPCYKIRGGIVSDPAIKCDLSLWRPGDVDAFRVTWAGAEVVESTAETKGYNNSDYNDWYLTCKARCEPTDEGTRQAFEQCQRLGKSLGSWDDENCQYSCRDEIPPCTQISEEQQRKDYCESRKTNYDPNICNYLSEETCEKGKHWSSSEPCGCVPDNATVPRKGANFCEMFVSIVNTKAGESLCSGGAVAADVTDFSGIVPDIVLRNGMRVFNASQNPTDISEFTLADGEHKNYIEKETGGTKIYTDEFGYTLYIDIDGAKNGNSKLWEDIFPFYVTLSGKVIPAYNTADISGFGGGSRYYLQTSILVDSANADGSNSYWLAGSKSVSFRESACRSGYVSEKANYCERNPKIEQHATCKDESNSCTIKKVNPIKWF